MCWFSSRSLVLAILLSGCARRVPFPAAPGASLNWIDLQPGASLKIENAYYKQGAPKRGIANFLGTETFSLVVHPGGKLEPTASTPLPARPPDQVPVTALVPASQQRKAAHRFYYQIVLNRASGSANAVLLSAKNLGEMEALSRQLSLDAAAICGPKSTSCTVFPEACSVAVVPPAR